MSLVLQFPEGRGLTDVLEDVSDGALSGGGVFAFATKRGVERFFAVPNIRRMLENGARFDLVVGTDAITNAEALVCIEEHVRRFANLHAWAFVHDAPTTFHPKYCWFAQQDELSLVVGSGNLTSSGIGNDPGPPQRMGNWEALSVRSLRGVNADGVHAVISRWLTDSRDGGLLLQLSHPRVLERAVANSRVKYVSPHTRQRRGARAPEPVEAQPQAADAQTEVMIREIPQNRSGQADISQRGLAFFGFAGQQRKVLIQNVSLNNELDVPVERLIFVNASQNYRIEIREVAELPYTIAPDDGRMVLVAIKLDENAYRYTVVPVDSPHYAALSAILRPIPAGRRLMRTAFVNAAELRAQWPAAPENLFPVVALTVEDVD
jgi:hypothetical protein